MSTHEETTRVLAQADAILSEFRERQKADLEKLRADLTRLGYEVEGKKPKEIKEIIQQPPTKAARP